MYNRSGVAREGVVRNLRSLRDAWVAAGYNERYPARRDRQYVVVAAAGEVSVRDAKVRRGGHPAFSEVARRGLVHAPALRS